MKTLVIALIICYQKFISPYKGFRCAHAVLHRGDSCSEAVKKIVRDKGPFGGCQDIRARFRACKDANEVLIRNRQRRRGQNHCDDCPDGECIDGCPSSSGDPCDGLGCDGLGCELPCDCSL